MAAVALCERRAVEPAAAEVVVMEQTRHRVCEQVPVEEEAVVAAGAAPPNPRA